MAGTLCANTSHFHSLSYFLHFGVSSDGVYHQKWTTHINSNWNGPGYTGQGVDSPLMLYEAILRFLHYFRGCEPRVVFSSYLWDIKRKQEYFYTMNDDVWISEFRTNFTRVLKTVSSLVRTTVEIPYGLTGARLEHNVSQAIFETAMRLGVQTFDARFVAPSLHPSKSDSELWWRRFISSL